MRALQQKSIILTDTSILYDAYARIVNVALDEDWGKSGDITSQLLIDATSISSCALVARQAMVVSAIDLVPLTLDLVAGRLQVDKCTVRLLAEDGQIVPAKGKLAEITGNTRVILAAERVVLNLLQHLSGVATLAHTYVKAIEGTDAILLDTRKTTAGLRALEKKAVIDGGGKNHRMRLDDAVLIKDNHIAAVGNIVQVVQQVIAKNDTKLPVIVECDTLEQVQQVIDLGIDRILLDNMSLNEMREAVAMASGKIALEASGGITLDTVGEIAQTGVDYISVGSITLSAPAVDIGLDIVGVADQNIVAG